jgi:DNA helicase II / ATP-dependent DNA helicase PcrA
VSAGPLGAQKTAVTGEESHMLVVAPPGCGKTEVLAMRAAHLLATGRVRPRRKILTLTFTNRARDNIKQRLHQQLGEARARRCVDVVNFHEFAIRLVQAHGNLVGQTGEVEYPNRIWMKRALAGRTPNWRAQKAAAEALDAAKREPLTDDELMKRLIASNDEIAVSVERERQEVGYLDYGDLLRYAQLILRDDRVAAVFKEHYDAVLVDEFQDLTLQQFDISRSVTNANSMYVGDPYQGIFGWAGAAPLEVHAQLKNDGYFPVDLDVSFRSSPAVLAVANALSAALGATALQAAEPERWPNGGVAYAMGFDIDDAEAQGVVALCDYLAEKYADDRIGVICRSEYRRGALEKAFNRAKHQPQFWDIALNTPQVAAMLKRQVRHVRRELPYKEQVEDLLQRVSATLRRSDVETLNDVQSACEQLLEMEPLGLDLSEVLSRIRDVRGSSASEPGVHVLNAHTGKGQQFDWVFVIGLEEGHVPSTYAETEADFLEEQRVLMVMVSRARRGVFLSHARQTTNRYGRVFREGPSRWWTTTAPACQAVPASIKKLTGCD